MFKRSILTTIVFLTTLGMMTSCILDPKQKEKKQDTSPPKVFQDLTQQDHVLNNLELAYNERDDNELDRILDGGFIFIFSPADFAAGITPEQWDKADEMRSARNIFDRNREQNRVTSIDLRLQYAPGNWTATSAPPGYPGETWYFKTVTYSLVINAEPDITYQGLDIDQNFTIRQTERDGKTIWQIMVTRDAVGL